MIGIGLISERNTVCRRSVTEMIRPRSPLHGVRSSTTCENVVAISTMQGVVAVSPQQEVVPSLAGQNIVAVQSCKGVSVDSTVQGRIVPFCSDDATSR